MSADAPNPVTTPEPASARAGTSLAVSIGNVLFHYRNGLFPVAFVIIALISRPRWLLGSPRADAILDAVGLAVALAGQALRAVVIGLAYIRRGGKDRRIYADTLVQDGFFAHSRNPLYVGNMLVYLGLFLVLNSVAGYAIGVPFFLVAYLCITAAEEDFLRRQFGAEYDRYVQRVPRYLPNLSGIGTTIRGMKFNWARLIRKEYGSTFSWMTTALALLVWESVRNRGVAASRGVMIGVLIAWIPIVAGYVVARVLKKTGRLRDAS